MAMREKAARRKSGESAEDRGHRADPATVDLSTETGPATDDLSTETGPYADELARRERRQELAERIRREASRAFYRDA